MSANLRPVLVTGSTGTVGRPLVARLLAAGHLVRALVRDPDRAEPPTGYGDALQLVRGDLTDPASIGEAARGIGSAFLLWPFPTVEGAEDAIAALVGSGVRRVVFLSSAVADADPARPEGAVEKLIEQAVPEWTFLRPHGYMANAWRWVPDLRADRAVHGAYGEAAMAPIHEADLAAVAAAALTGDGRHHGHRYLLTGPAALTQSAQVAALAEATGLPLVWDELPRAAAHAKMTATGWPATIIDTVLDYQADRVGSPEPWLTTFEEVTGHPGRTFADWAADHAAALRLAITG